MPDLQANKKRKNEDHLSDSEEKKRKHQEYSAQMSLLEAARKGLKDDVLGLIQSGSDINIKYQSGWTPLHLALQFNHMEIASVLVNHGPDVNAKNKDGRTPLHLAVQVESKDLTNAILEKGADVNVKDNRGFTSLHLAVDFDNQELVSLF